MKIEDYVHEYYSAERFRATYQGRVEPFPYLTQWPEVHLGFKIFPPLLGRPPGRPRVQRIRGYLEWKANKKKVKCKRCGDFDHFANGEIGDISKQEVSDSFSNHFLCIL